MKKKGNRKYTNNESLFYNFKHIMNLISMLKRFLKIFLIIDLKSYIYKDNFRKTFNKHYH